MFSKLKKLGKGLSQVSHMLVGMPDYDNYVAHLKAKHPDREPMSYDEFFRERQEARYGGGKGRSFRCC